MAYHGHSNHLFSVSVVWLYDFGGKGGAHRSSLSLQFVDIFGCCSFYFKSLSFFFTCDYFHVIDCGCDTPHVVLFALIYLGSEPVLIER